MGGIFGRRHRGASRRANRWTDRRTERRAESEADHRQFPAVVAAGSLLLALLLFFQSTVPALKESHELLRIEEQQRQLLRELTREATAFALRRTALSRDIQTVLVELDRQGIYPAELLEELREAARAAAAARQPSASGAGDPQ